MRAARKRVDFFLNNPQWYRDRGIPYTLGILLHGAPGCGKTSFIKGLARDTGRHVVNVKLGECTTVQQINALFYSPRLQVVRDGMNAYYDIPMERRILVMEDIDCLSGIVRDRNASAPQDDGEGNPNQLNLSVLLNILDGVLETPGRIVIMTSNAPWTLDRALVRPGRIDVTVEFTKCTPDDVLDMVEGICCGGSTQGIDRELWRPRLADKAWTHAEVTKAIFENMEDPDP
jgi:ATP-dependent 26S proteasome regulatory subunit